jgi:hypothetical protein
LTKLKNWLNLRRVHGIMEEFACVRKGGLKMRQGLSYRGFVCFLCFSFLLMVSGIPKVLAETEQRDLLIGEMISTGEVKFEAREEVWEKVESFHFPMFRGVRVRTDKGQAFIALDNNSQIEVGQNSIFSFQQSNQFHLLQGQVSFHIPSGAELVFRVGDLSIGKVHPKEVSNRPLPVSPAGKETVGSITLHSGGSVTVVGIRGPLFIQDHDRAVLAAVSSGESLTIPSVTASRKQGNILAQVGEPEPGEVEPIEEPIGEPSGAEPPFGLDSWTPVWVGAGLVVTGTAFLFLAGSGGGSSSGVVVVSP